MRVLVVGGAGYVGSHCVRRLALSGHEPVVLDSLVFGHREAVAGGIPFLEFDLRDATGLKALLDDYGIDSVMHFAAFAYVGESVQDPVSGSQHPGRSPRQHVQSSSPP